MKHIFLLIAFLTTSEAIGQIAITPATLRYIQNFDSLDASGSAQTTMPSGWSFFEWGGSSANGTYRTSTGTGTSGDTYSYGSAGSSERALGSLCSSGLQNVCYGLRFVNQTGDYINAVDISFRVEQWRRNGSGKTDSILFYYSTASGAAVFDTSYSGWKPVPELLSTSVTTALPAAAVNGNDTFQKLAYQLPLALAPGDSICFRWYDYNAAASDDGLAIDSLSMLFHVGVPPGLFRPNVLHLFPEPGTQHVPASVVPYIVFNRSIRKGSTGAVYIKDRSTQLVQSLTVGASKLYISGDTAKMYLLNLKAGTTYQITFDSTTFDTAGFHCLGLYDSSAWTFSTEATQVSELISEGSFKIINPVLHGALTVQYTGMDPLNMVLQLFDSQGRIILTRDVKFDQTSPVFRSRIDAPRGLYLLRLSSKGEVVVRKVLLE